MTRYMLVGSFFIILVTLELGLVSGSGRCFQCHSKASDCRHEHEVCQNNSSCFIKSYVPVNETNTIYQTGCITSSECQQICQKNSNSTNISCKVLCCSEDFCNNIDHFINSATRQHMNVIFASFFAVLALIKMLF